ncbi:MAG TPA: hypothetical protein VIJ15_12260 [Dermatophilaceae bacterium]
MSGPGLFDRMLGQSEWTPSVGGDLQPFTHPVDRRSLDSLLSREHDVLCRNAADPLEIAAGLEAAGISDRHARASYGVATVFELAEQLYSQVPRRLFAVPKADPWARPRRELLARGLIYALPGLLLVACVQHLVIAEAMILLLVSVVTAGANQALSRLYYLLAGRKKLAAAASLLRQALVGSALAGALVGWLASSVGAVSLPGAALSALAVIYLVSATVVLLLDRHRILLRLLLPAVAMSLASMFVPPDFIPFAAARVAGVMSIAGVVTVVGAFVTAWCLARELASPEEPARVVSLTWSDFGGSLSLFAHGCLSMTLLSLIPLTSMHTATGTPAALGPVMLPAMLSLGAAEVHLYGFRQRAAGLLAGSSLSAFARAVRLHMLSRVTSYALLLIILTAAVAVVGRGSLAADADASGHLLTYLLLCLALFVASLLVSTGYVRTVVMIEVAALMLDVTMSHLPTSLASLTSAAVHVGSAGVLTAMMLVFGWVRLGRVVSYR